MTLYDDLLAQHPFPHVALGRLVEQVTVQAPEDDESSADVGFFRVALAPDADIDAETLVRAIKAAKEGEFQALPVERLAQGPSYIEVGAWLGDQGRALLLMGLGQLLGIWQVMTPKVLGVVDEDEAKRMMGMGLVMAVPGPDSLLLA